MKFKSKASTLGKIRVKKTKIPNFFFFTVKDYKKNKKKIIYKIFKKFKHLIAIRSSSLQEDSRYSSMAGYFKSFLDIDSKNSSVKQTSHHPAQANRKDR